VVSVECFVELFMTSGAINIRSRIAAAQCPSHHATSPQRRQISRLLPPLVIPQNHVRTRDRYSRTPVARIAEGRSRRGGRRPPGDRRHSWQVCCRERAGATRGKALVLEARAAALGVSSACVCMCGTASQFPIRRRRRVSSRFTKPDLIRHGRLDRQQVEDRVETSCGRCSSRSTIRIGTIPIMDSACPAARDSGRRYGTSGPLHQ
jgi:hypothetical protein